MLRKLLATTLLLATACTPVPTTPPATVPSVPTATAVASVPPVRTDTPAPTVFSATVDPTMPAPLYLLHPSRVGLGTVDVIKTWCFSETTVIAIYEFAAEWHYDDAAYQECVSRGVLQ